MRKIRAYDGFVAQLVERRAFNPAVAGSNPVGPKFFFYLLKIPITNLKIFPIIFTGKNTIDKSEPAT